MLPNQALQVSAAAMLKLHWQKEKYNLALDILYADLSQKKKKEKKKNKPTRAKRAPPAAVPRSFLAHGRLPLQSKIDALAEYVVLKLIAQQEKIL